MKVIVNGRFLLHRTTGVERYAREILLELDKLIKQGEIEIAIPPETKEIPDYKNNKYFEERSFLRKIIEKSRLLTKIYCWFYNNKTK